MSESRPLDFQTRPITIKHTSILTKKGNRTFAFVWHGGRKVRIYRSDTGQHVRTIGNMGTDTAIDHFRDYHYRKLREADHD